MSQHFSVAGTLWEALRHADWQEASARTGILGIIAEFFRAVTGLNAWPFFVPVDSDWEPAAIRAILRDHGIANWGWGRHRGEFFFQVKLRQASWAQYLLQQSGVPLSGQLLDEGARSAYRPAARRSPRPAWRPSPRATRVHPPTGHSATGAPAAKPEAAPSLFTDPIGQINRAVDRLAKW